MKRKQIVLTAIVSAACVVTAYAATEISAGETKKIRALMEIIGAKNISRQVAMSFSQQLSYGLKQSQPDIDPKAFSIVASVTDEELSKHSNELLEKMVPLYAKHFTEAELDGMLAFYNSPVGRKMIEAMPALMEESMELAISESKGLVPAIQAQVTERLRADGLVKAKP